MHICDICEIIRPTPSTKHKPCGTRLSEYGIDSITRSKGPRQDDGVHSTYRDLQNPSSMSPLITTRMTRATTHKVNPARFNLFGGGPPPTKNTGSWTLSQNGDGQLTERVSWPRRFLAAFVPSSSRLAIREQASSHCISPLLPR